MADEHVDQPADAPKADAAADAPKDTLGAPDEPFGDPGYEQHHPHPAWKTDDPPAHHDIPGTPGSDKPVEATNPNDWIPEEAQGQSVPEDAVPGQANPPDPTAAKTAEAANAPPVESQPVGDHPTDSSADHPEG